MIKHTAQPKNTLKTALLFTILLALAIGMTGCGSKTSTTACREPEIRAICSRPGCTEKALRGETLCIDHLESERWASQRKVCIKERCNSTRAKGDLYCPLHMDYTAKPAKKRTEADLKAQREFYKALERGIVDIGDEEPDDSEYYEIYLENQDIYYDVDDVIDDFGYWD